MAGTRGTSPRRRKGAGFDLVIFDCDGVLVDSEVISCGVVALVLSRWGVPCVPEEAFRRYLGRPASAVTEDYMRLSGRPLPASFMSEWRSRLFAELKRGLRPIEGVRSAIEALGIPFCLASSSDPLRIALSLRLAGLDDLFTGRIFSTTMVRNGKPAPDLFLLAAETMGMAPASCLVIEDSVSGIHAAKAAGMTAFGFTGGAHHSLLPMADALVEAGADAMLGAMAELPGRAGSFAWSERGR
jgi:HAD superfamily hydrolase (TIGR01509 family)